MKTSIIVPAYNEEDNIQLLAESLTDMIEKHGLDAEIVLVDDGSTDRTWDRALEMENKYSNFKAVQLRKNSGKTGALVKGFDAASGDVYLIFDADLQFDPDDVPAMIAEIDNGADVVTGWKQGSYTKWFVSGIYNLLSRRLFGLNVHDLNSMKAFRREVLNDMVLRKDWHRYMVALAADQGFRIHEIKVRLRPRRYGKTKYGFWRIPVGFLDLLAVKFRLSFMSKPLLLFGSIGIVLFATGFLVGCYALYLRFVLQHGYRPLAYLVTLLVVSGLILFAVGFLAEVMAEIRGRLDGLERKVKERSGEE